MFQQGKLQPQILWNSLYKNLRTLNCLSSLFEEIRPTCYRINSRVNIVYDDVMMMILSFRQFSMSHGGRFCDKSKRINETYYFYRCKGSIVTHFKIHDEGSKNAKEIFRGSSSGFLTEEFHRFAEFTG